MQETLGSLDDALHRIQSLLASSNIRTVIGVFGKPGCGKSTFSHYLSENLPSELVAIVPMDGFHLSNKVLAELGRTEYKGAPDTFDVMSFAALLRRIRNENDSVIYYPVFDRSIEESIAAQGKVSASIKVVIVEGNYLLHDEGPWSDIASLLDESWYLDLPDEVRVERLIERHIRYGKSPADADAWVRRTDEKNAELIGKSASRADFVLNLN